LESLGLDLQTGRATAYGESFGKVLTMIDGRSPSMIGGNNNSNKFFTNAL